MSTKTTDAVIVDCTSSCAADMRWTKRILPDANILRRRIPNRDKFFFDELVASGQCLPWSRKKLPPVRKNARFDRVHEHYIDYDHENDSSLFDGVIWSGRTPSQLFVGLNVVLS